MASRRGHVQYAKHNHTMAVGVLAVLAGVAGSAAPQQTPDATAQVQNLIITHKYKSNKIKLAPQVPPLHRNLNDMINK